MTIAAGDANADLLRLRDVAWRRGGLHDLSFRLGTGEFLSLLGPRGAGKTALLAVLAGLARADRGEIDLLGLPIGRTPAHRRGIGVVFADENLFPHLTVAENVALPMRLRALGDHRHADRIAEMLDLLLLNEVAAQRPAQLSRLAVRRAALARALVFAPQLLLLDDILDGCDADERSALRDDLARLRRLRGFGVIMATRDAAEARRMSDRLAVLVGGTTAQIGSPSEVYDQPVSLGVAACTGELNRLPGVLGEIEDDIFRVALDCGPVVEVGISATIGVGDRCVVMVRPERVAVAAATAEELGDGAVGAVVLDLVDLGDHLRLELRAGDDRIVVRRPAGAAIAGLSPGSTVAIAWQPHHALAMKP